MEFKRSNLQESALLSCIAEIGNAFNLKNSKSSEISKCLRAIVLK